MLNSFLNVCIHALAVFLFSNYLIFTASATYNSRRAHYKENFDPAEADPRGNVSCVGDTYDLKLPMLENFNPNGLSMQKLCVKPQYGGGAQYQHVGAYCYNPLGSSWMSGSDYESNWSSSSSDEFTREPAVMQGKIVFDSHRGAHASQELQNPRLMQACIYRCFCSYGVEDVLKQPLSRNFPVELWDAQLGYQLQIDINNDFTIPRANKMGESTQGILESTPIVTKPQIDSHGAGFLPHTAYMNLDPGNEIECTGDLPDFVFPSPFTRADFSSTQELCAVALSGGNK